ncbi:MAG: hypothetical protein AAF721_35650 [Myxococcota bacterium]
MATSATATRFAQLALLVMATTAVGCDGEGPETIGPRGGTVTSADGRVTLEIPPGALDHDVALYIGEVDGGPQDALGYAYEIEPAMTVFHQPAAMSFDLDAVGSADGARSINLADAGMELADVTVVAEKATRWEALADIEEDDDTMTLSGSVLYTTTFAVVPR